MQVIAALWNRATGSNLPEDGWGIRYLGLPLSMEERKLIMDDHRQRAELGITSKAELLSQLDGITLDQARAKLIQIDMDNARFGLPSETSQPNPGMTNG